MFLAKIYIYYKTGVLDPQSSAIKTTISNCGFEQVKDVQTGKFYKLKVDTQDKVSAQQIVTELCEKVLSNPVIEDFVFEIMEA
ncbi:MAG: phosphoribosylformylglycinamidine synthase subunit PurS [Thermoanaerobacteraceae bacterium]|nr:phosphoribosylformylglycinamidine synthase subunit PurS [Thermoanaerobacteraceae bacterium]